MVALLLALRVVVAGESEGIFPANSSVILVVGLPGDLESEKLYSDQLGAWIDLIAQSDRVQKVFVLCDSPQAVHLPARLNAQVLKGDRATFLSLGKELGTNSAIVIAWGHGGRQGNKPVLHVAGPRLMPADFRAIAAQIQGPQSRWLLLFRGSGMFARELAGEGREIISSEQETMFDSDPIGMSQLLKLLRETSNQSFAKAGEAMGKQIAAWYGGRNLARTEEPTLWIGKEGPRSLSPVEGDSFASKPLESDSKSEKGPPQSQPSAIWEEIKRVPPDHYPESDGVVLRRRISYTLGTDPAVQTEEEEFIQVLSWEGKHLGDFDVSYTPPSEEIEFLDCEVLSPEGKLARLDPDQIREEHTQSLGDYQADRRKFFSLPGVMPGAVLHIRYRREWKKFPLPYASFEIQVQSELPVLGETIQVTVPKDDAFHFSLNKISGADPTRKSTSYGVGYSWRFENLPARAKEILASPESEPRLMISTFPDWKAFAEWYARISKGADELTPEIRSKALELTTDAKGEREKVLGLFNYVTGLRYVAVPLGINSVRPHAAGNVLRNQFGDCKDKANLFNSLLHAIDIEAQLVLVPRFSQAYETIPGLAFNHAISRIVVQDQPMWVDTTDDVCRFGMLPPGDPGRKVLVIDGLTTSLTQLPEPRSGDHRLDLHGKIGWGQNGEVLPTELQVTSTGYVDYELRTAAREIKERSPGVPLLASRFQPMAGSFALERQNSSSISTLNENFSWQANGSTIGITSALDKEWVVQAPFWLPAEWRRALHRRKAPLFLNLGYPLTLDEELEFALPAGVQRIRVPGVKENNTQPLRWRIEWVTIGQDKLTARLHVELMRGELSDAQTALFQEEVPRLLSALAASARWSAP